MHPPVTIRLEKSEDALEFFGIMMGDGCVTEYYSRCEHCDRSAIFVSCNAHLDFSYISEYIRNLLLRTFDTKAYLRIRKDSQTADLMIRNKQLVIWLKGNGFPSGKKGQISIPKRIEKLPFSELRFLIRGLFDTDGCLSARKSEGYRDPFVLISSSSKPLRKQLKQILRKQGFPAYDSSGMVGIKGAKYVRRWFEEIGSNNPRNLLRYQYWAEHGVLPSGKALKRFYITTMDNN